MLSLKFFFPKSRPFIKNKTEVYFKPAIKTDVQSIGIGMGLEASKNTAVEQAHTHMCYEAEVGPEPRIPAEWHWEGAVEDLRRPCSSRRHTC